MRKPFFKKSHNAWYVHHQGRMIRLSDDKETAFQLYHELKASQAPATSSDSVAGLLNSYLEWCQKNRAERRYDWYREFLSSFAKSIGLRLRIGGIKPLHVTQWLDGQTWNSTTKYNAVGSCSRVPFAATPKWVAHGIDHPFRGSLQTLWRNMKKNKTRTQSIAQHQLPAHSFDTSRLVRLRREGLQSTFIREARVNYLPCIQPVFKITCPADAAEFVRSILTDNSREHFVALYLNSIHGVAAYSIVSIGTANSALASPREVFQRAVLTGAISILVSHNHPSGTADPSHEDKVITKRLRDAGKILGIPILDHVIVTNDAFLSLKDHEAL